MLGDVCCVYVMFIVNVLMCFKRKSGGVAESEEKEVRRKIRVMEGDRRGGF